MTGAPNTNTWSDHSMRSGLGRCPETYELGTRFSPAWIGSHRLTKSQTCLPNRSKSRNGLCRTRAAFQPIIVPHGQAPLEREGGGTFRVAAGLAACFILFSPKLQGPSHHGPFLWLAPAGAAGTRLQPQGTLARRMAGVFGFRQLRAPENTKRLPASLLGVFEQANKKPPVGRLESGRKRQW